MDKYLQQNYYRNKVFNLIQVGIWTIELENGKLPRMYADNVMKKLLGVDENISPEDCYMSWYSRIFSSHINIVEEAIGKLISGKKAEITYPWMNNEGKLRYIRCGGERDFSYKKGIRFLGYHHDVTTIILDKKQRQDSEKPVISDYILHILASVYEGIHLVDFRTEKVTPIKASNYNEWSGMNISQDEYLNILRKLVSNDIVNVISNSIKKQEIIDENGNEKPYFTKDYNKSINGIDHWYNVFICMDETSSNNVMLIAFRDINEIKSEQVNALETIKKLKYQSEYDALTGIFNRFALENHIKTYLEQNNHTTAFILIDLDNFKKVNDTLGHIEGDVLLMEVAEKLKQLCSQDDEVGRLGGDEFVVFVKKFNNTQYIENLVSQIISKLEKTYNTDSEQIQVTASVGIAISNQENCTFSKLYHAADKALYASKYKGKNTYTFFA